MQMLRIKYVVYFVLRTLRNVKLTDSMFSLLLSRSTNVCAFASKKMDLIYTSPFWNKLQKVNHIMNAECQ